MFTDQVKYLEIKAFLMQQFVVNFSVIYSLQKVNVLHFSADDRIGS